MGFLTRVPIILAISLIGTPLFVRCVHVREIDPDDTDADGVSALPLEVFDLRVQVIGDPVDLLDHRLSKDLYFDPDLNGRNLTASDAESQVYDRGCPWDDVSKRAVPAPSFNSTTAVASGQNALVPSDPL